MALLKRPRHTITLTALAGKIRKTVNYHSIDLLWFLALDTILFLSYIDCQDSGLAQASNQRRAQLSNVGLAGRVLAGPGYR